MPVQAGTGSRDASTGQVGGDPCPSLVLGVEQASPFVTGANQQQSQRERAAYTNV